MTAKRDDNRIPTIIGLLDSDGTTITNLQVDATLHTLKVHDNTAGTDYGNGQDDDNNVPIAMAVSNADGLTPVALYVNSDGSLLVKST